MPVSDRSRRGQEAMLPQKIEFHLVKINVLTKFGVIVYSEGLQSTISQRLLCRLYTIPLVMMHINI